MTEPFFPTYKEKYTRTPNVFFDKIINSEGVTVNEIRIVAYLIRNTLGYNRESKWIGVTRNDFIQCGISNTRLTAALKACEEKGWILTYMEGSKGHQKRYIFLNDELNQQVVEGLKAGKFTIEDLEYLNLAGVLKLLGKEEKDLPSRGGRSNEGENPDFDVPSRYTESGEQNSRNRKKSGSGTTDSVEQKRAKSCAKTRNSSTLNTSTINKDLNTSKDNRDPRYTKFYDLFPDL